MCIAQARLHTQPRPFANFGACPKKGLGRLGLAERASPPRAMGSFWRHGQRSPGLAAPAVRPRIAREVGEEQFS